MNNQISESTRALIDGLALDILPRFSTQVDFGIQPNEDPTEVFGALQWAWRNRTATEEEIDEALGNGPRLTELVNRPREDHRNNPYACNIKTAWDDVPTE